MTKDVKTDKSEAKEQGRSYTAPDDSGTFKGSDAGSTFQETNAQESSDTMLSSASSEVLPPKGSTDSSNQKSTTSSSGTLSEIQSLKELAEKYKNDFLYLRAEFDNYKKHVIKERSDYLKYGSERVIASLLDVVDNFDRALSVKVSQENFSNFVTGVEMTANELRSLLSKFGANPVESLGKPFDPSLHEALSSEVSEQVAPGHVVRELKKAYKLHDKLIRHAQVIVAQAAPKK